MYWDPPHSCGVAYVWLSGDASESGAYWVWRVTSIQPRPIESYRTGGGTRLPAVEFTSDNCNWLTGDPSPLRWIPVFYQALLFCEHAIPLSVWGGAVPGLALLLLGPCDSAGEECYERPIKIRQLIRFMGEAADLSAHRSLVYGFRSCLSFFGCIIILV